MEALHKVLLLVAVKMFLLTLHFSSTSAHECWAFNGQGCKQCTENKHNRCYWCNSDRLCREWKWGKHQLLPTDIDCKGYNWNYQSCSINGVGLALIISAAVLVVLVLIICICCTICCCVCRARRSNRRWRQHHDVQENEMRGFTERSAQRHALRKNKANEIRRKYGLDSGDPDSEYEKFI